MNKIATLLLVLSVGTVVFMFGFNVGKQKNPCFETLLTSKIVSREVDKDNNIIVKLAVGDKVQSLLVSSTTPEALSESIQVGKEFNVCYIIR